MNEDKVTRVCQDCGENFETYRLLCLGVDRYISDACPKCRTKKREHFESAERQRLESESIERKSNWRIDSGIPQRFRSERFETFKLKSNNLKKIHTLCHEYADNFPLGRKPECESLGIFSKGVWGLGKSHLVCSIGHRIIDRWLGAGTNSPVYYITEPQMFSRIRATFNRGYDNNSETEEQVYHHLINVPLLIVDDIGKEEVADPRFVQRVWFSIVNGRYDNVLPLVITANLDPDGIANHLGGSRNNEAAFDRLYQMLGGVFWEMVGESHRRQLPDGK